MTDVRWRKCELYFFSVSVDQDAETIQLKQRFVL
ncbi:hypothetical protein CH64_709 [Yersinia rohdei]|uniref:Uncharacterized protein n=1 Tax=Yersinia rohdei TaxID=29485 RepID=A0A0U1HP54_YERRO|nr:hypothetical protein CH64_709 [Yersinia rohdei]CNE08317.1 Uncharacterised protein [Yersinia rohdei]CNI35065.1 Uncharacterised protein [Yersinia rohdei]CQI88375.1 Uncharacterised protein [Yersinia rohdei]CQJ46604.1 Uncharacterised protein [Yersinia rohdei]